MCELLGMSANVPTEIVFSFSGLVQRGGKTGPHKDGWGIAFYEGKGVRVFRDPAPSIDSEQARVLQRIPIKSTAVIGHIRQANAGRICLENTHPFVREQWCRHWTYAHNGQLRGLKKWPLNGAGPIGSTDSEHAFCWLLAEINRRFPKPPGRPQTLWRFVKSCCDQLKGLGVFNMLLSDGRYLLAYCSTKLSWITRRAPFGHASLIDTDMQIDFRRETTESDVVSIIATEPLTDNEIWHVIEPGTMLVFRDGELVKSLNKK